MKILLGVTGGIAVYKAAELTRELQRRGTQVQVCMTASAERFITPLTFASLSGQQVLTSLWTPTTPEATSADPADFDIEHIRIAQQIDALVIAPATANCIAKLAHGLADNLLSTIALATQAPIVLAPAMNVNMWHHPATQANLALLRARGVHIVPPASGHLACGMTGDGRLADPTTIADAVFTATNPPCDLLGQTILITAGGTREPIDAVRYLGNRSSGRMGLAVAEAAHARGAEVILITAAPAPANQPPWQQLQVTTAAEMQAAVLAHLPRATAVFMAAAVADYRVLNPAPHKLKKQPKLTLDLVPNEDILRHIVHRRRPETIVIGFAAETGNLLEEGRRKLHEKAVDAIFANDVSSPDSGFEVDRNAGTLITPTAELPLPPSTKRELADRLLDHLETLRATHLTYRVTWSPEDGEYLGLCSEFPSLSWLAATPADALSGIRQTVLQSVADIQNR
jgi:phosphopantothenoylcysteine decarboxylase/phosphopantothenate--cysteine ligase